MRSIRRTIGHLLVALLLAGCAAAPSAASFGPPTSAPTSSPEPTGTPAAPTPSPPTLPTASVLPEPAEGCLGIDDADLAGMEVTLDSVDAAGNGGGIGISAGRLGAILDVTRVTELAGKKRSIAPAAPARQHDRGLLLGGHEFVAFPSTWFDGHVNPQALISASVTLALEGQAPIALATRFIPGNVNFDQVAVTVPDGAGPGTLSVAFVWADPCFRYEAAADIPVDVVPLSQTAGCALEQDAYFSQVSRILAGSLRIGSASIRAFSPRNEAKFAPWINYGIDAFPVYAFNRDEPAIIAAQGSALTIERASSDVTLGNDTTLVVWTRASVAKAIKDYPPNGTVEVLSRTPVKRPDGTFRLRVPQEPGRYVAAVTMTYDSHCSSGALWFLVNIDVVTPTPTASPAT